jgi:hypothetical protein
VQERKTQAVAIIVSIQPNNRLETSEDVIEAICIPLSSFSQCDCRIACWHSIRDARLYFVMLVVGSNFGLDNVRPGGVVGTVLGIFLALRFPRRWSLWDLTD